MYAAIMVLSNESLSWKRYSEPVIYDLFTAFIDDTVIQNLIADFEFSEEKAIDLYFNSNTYRQLIDENTGLHKKTWNEIYQIIIKELKL